MNFTIMRKKTLISIINIWLNNKNNIKIQTYQKYKNTTQNYIENSNIGNVYISKLNKKRIKQFFIELDEDKVSKSIQKTIFYIINSALCFGYNNNYCKKIDLNDIKIGKEKTKIDILTAQEQIRIEKYLKNNINIRKICVLLCLYSGLRIGEVCGLKWKDIDFDNKTLEIKRTIQRIKNDNPNIRSKTILIESTPKSESSKRVVPIANFLVPLLKKLETNGDYYLLSNSKKMYDPRLLEYFFKNVLMKCNVKNKNFHILRHTFATRSIEAKVDIKTLSEILGHSNIDITLKLYVHPSIDLKKNSIENVVEFMYPYHKTS